MINLFQLTSTVQMKDKHWKTVVWKVFIPVKHRRFRTRQLAGKKRKKHKRDLKKLQQENEEWGERKKKLKKSKGDNWKQETGVNLVELFQEQSMKIR